MHRGGYLFIDEPALQVIENRLGPDTISTVIMPQLEYASKSELPITLLASPVSKEIDGTVVVESVVSKGERIFRSPSVTLSVYAIKRGAFKDQVSMDSVSKLRAHLLQSVKFTSLKSEKLSEVLGKPLGLF